MNRRFQGFTLIELLITVLIIAALGAAGSAVLGSARRKARCAVEIQAARNLIAGYLSQAAENSGRVMAGYQAEEGVTNIEGEPLHFPLNARYPWRLAPNVPKIEGVLLFNGNEAALNDRNRDYLVSVQPNLGLNTMLVGGNFGTGSPLPPTPKLTGLFGKFCLTHLSDSDSPEKLIVFASARSGGNKVGYYEVRPPNLNRRIWSPAPFSGSTQAQDHGFTDFRWGGAAVCAMLGGNVGLMDEKSMRDMRRWSIQAQRANAPDFMIQAP